jgi:hypothetical protein
MAKQVPEKKPTENKMNDTEPDTEDFEETKRLLKLQIASMQEQNELAWQQAFSLSIKLRTEVRKAIHSQEKRLMELSAQMPDDMEEIKREFDELNNLLLEVAQRLVVASQDARAELPPE